MELSDLPNGLHDAGLVALAADYEAGEVVLTVDVDVSSTDESTPVYRRARVTFTGVGHCAIDPPGPGGRTDDSLDLDHDTGQPSRAPEPRMELGPDYTLHYLYVRGWNSFIRIAAKASSVSWV